MKLIKCPKCGNTEEFYEKTPAIMTNYFRQNKDGTIEKTDTEQERDSDRNSQLYCSKCDERIEEDYDLFLDRYSDSLFSARK